MTKVQAVRAALLEGQNLSMREMTNFNAHKTTLNAAVASLRKDGIALVKQRDSSGAMYYRLGTENDVDTAAVVQARPHQPQPGDNLLVRGLFLDDTGEIEVQASGPDGTYLLRVIAHRPGKTRG